MANSNRKSGIDVIRHIVWGTHLCQFYETKEDLIDILVPYFKAGLDNNEFCMWVTSEPLGVKEATASLGKAVRDLDGYIAKGQLEILDYSQWYTKSGKFDADEVLQGWIDKEKMALEKGFSGLRLTGNTFWLDPGDWKSFCDYEATVNSVIGSHRMIAICTYSLDKCGAPEILDVISNHEFALIRREGVWVAIESAERNRIDQRWHSLLANAPSIIMIIGRDGTIQFINHTVSGLEVEEVIGKSIFDYIQPEYHDIARETNSRVFETGKTGKYEIKGTGPDGRTSWYETDVGAIKDGKLVTSIMQITSDITERKQTEEELRETRDYLSNLIRHANAPIIVWDAELRITTFNTAFERLTGYMSGEVIGQALNMLFPEANHDKSMSKISQALKGEYWESVEIPILRKDGRIRTVLFNSANIYDKDDKILIAIIAQGYDITERRQTEETLKSSEINLRSIIDSNIDGMVIIDKQGTIRFVNPAAESLFSRNSEELVGSMFGFALVEDKSTELEIIRPDNNRLVIEARIGNTEWEGEIMSLLSLRDITERKKMQQELIISDRLASIGALVAGVAHEINNPLTGVIGFSDLLLDKKDIADDIREDLNTISSEAKRAARIVKNLLTFARKPPTKSETVNIHKLIENTLALRVHQLKLNNIEVNTKFASDLPEVIINSSELQQIFMNIIINAEFFMIEAHKKGTLTIATECVGPIVKVSFTDDGPGISRGNLTHLFDPFFTTKEVGKGTGLGLSISYGIITEAGGKIYAESQLGKGATFIVALPAVTPGVGGKRDENS